MQTLLSGGLCGFGKIKPASGYGCSFPDEKSNAYMNSKIPVLSGNQVIKAFFNT